MKIAKVTYTTQADYAERNKANIQSVMNDLQQMNVQGLNYNACVGPDGKSFVHMAYFENDEAQKILFDLPSFKSFQEQLKNSNPETPPKPEMLTLVGSSTPIFPGS